MTSLDKWLEAGRHLPKFLRDFHDQKSVFKFMHSMYEQGAVPQDRRPDWVTGHTYVIDWFLWFMAQRGYTLQKSRAPIGFKDLSGELIDFEKSRAKGFFTMTSKPTVASPVEGGQ